MNGMLRDLLSERADAAGSPELDLHDLVARGEQSVSRRRRAAVGGTVAAVVLTVGASFALVQTGDRTTSPVGPPTNPPSTTVDVPPDSADGSEPLTYGVGATIHYGDRIIEAPEDVDGLFVFDGGLAILTGDDGNPAENRLFLTDGESDPVEIARAVEQLTAGEIGSLMVWLDGDDVVVYDVHLRAMVARVPLNGMRLTNPIVPLEDAVYWTEYDDSTDTGPGDGQLVRYDVSTGTRTRASEADVLAEARTTPPVLVVGSPASTAPVESFTVADSQLVVDTRSERPGPAFVAATGERLHVRVPDQYDGVTMHIYQWLDDDRFALVAEGGVKRAPIGDLLLCRISAGVCHTVASGAQYWLLPSDLISSVGTGD
jgi:hypothetical protein